MTVSIECIEGLIHNVVIPRVAPNKIIEIDPDCAKVIDLLV